MGLTGGVNPIDTVLEYGRQNPAALAVASADFTMTASDFADSVLRFAARLRQLGVAKGSVVAVSTHPAIEAVITLALLHEGAISLSGTPAVLRAYSPNIDLVLADAPVQTAARTITVDGEFLASLGAVSIDIVPAQLADSDVCRIVFSSGTTGTPKGVEFTVAALLARTDAARTNWMPADPFMCLLGLDTVSGIQTFYWSVFHGATYFVASTGPRNREVIERYGVRSIKTSPARLADLLDAQPASGLDVVQVAGSLLTPALGLRCEAVLGVTPVYLYGSTEVGTVSSGTFDATQPHVVGTLISSVDFELVDAAGQPVTEPDTEGTIRYRSAVMVDHYWLADGDPASAFRDGWFYPGDVGALSAEEQLRISGRTNDVVNANGAKFNLAELDIWLSELRIFTDAASFSFTTDAGVGVGIAFVAKAHVGQEIVVEQLATRFPNLAVGALIKLDAIPRNQLGKVDRLALQSMHSRLLD
jgi:long-chain acyl-CoA synthetase